jgi:CRISPR-associated endonuclease/helicase Cas3
MSKKIRQLFKNSKIEYLNGKKLTVLAHYSEGNKKEKYHTHIEKMNLLFDELINRKENTYFKLFKNVKNNHSLDIKFNSFKSFLSELVNFHDIAKCNLKFQRDVLESPYFSNLEIVDYKEKNVSSDHSFPSAFVAGFYLFKKYNTNQNPLLLLFLYLIWGHHTKLKNVPKNNLFDIKKENKKYLETCEYLFELLGVKDLVKNNHSEVLSAQKNLKKILKNKHLEESSISFLYNLLYSDFITADSISTSYSYVNLPEFKTEIPNLLNDRIDESMYERMSDCFLKKQEEFSNPTRNIDKTRSKMYLEAIQGVKKGLKEEKRVFYLKMPTGGGKTNTSMGLALKIFKNTSANRLIYSLPYTVIIDQNYDYIKDNFNLEEPNEIRKIYSGSENIFEEKNVLEILEDDQFYNYPVVCTTNVSFFNSIAKFSKKEEYKFQSLANSVIILDEIQSLPVDHWPTLNYLIQEIADKLNIYFIVMSATVPKLEELLISKKLKKRDNIHYLLDSPESYFKEFGRNELKNNSLPEFDIEKDKKNLKSFLKRKLKKNFKHNSKGLVVVNTVKDSKEVYSILKDISEFDSIEKDLLNSTFLSYKKDQIIEKINKDKLENYLLISTQSIEAGVDVDFDFVLRDFATLDSIQQIRGRCNREMENNSGNVYLFKLKKDNFIPSDRIYNDLKMEATQEVLTENNFDIGYPQIESYYENLISKINNKTTQVNKITEEENIEYFAQMNYEESNYYKNKDKDVFHLDIISSSVNNFSFFVEMNIPLKFFSDSEINFLNQKGLIDSSTQRMANGAKVLNYYNSAIENNSSENNYQNKLKLSKQFSSILQKFIFQSGGNLDEEEIVYKLGKKVNYFYVIKKGMIEENNGEEDFYSRERGFIRDKFKDTTNTWLI